MTGIDHAARTAELEAEEARLAFEYFDFAEAYAIGHRLLETAPAPIALRIQVGDRVLFAAAHDGTSADNQVWLDLKSAAVRQFGHSTLAGCTIGSRRAAAPWPRARRSAHR